MKNPKSFFSLTFITAFVLVALSCVDQIEYNINGRLNMIVVDGRITNLDEEQLVKLSRSRSDSVTGRFGSLPITNAKVELVVNGTQVVPFVENKDIPGSYQLPEHYRGEIGNTYQLRFRLNDGTSYESSVETLNAVPEMKNVRVRFDGTAPADPTLRFNGFHEIYIDTQDPPNEKNYYNWEWVLYEKQPWCRTCHRGVYAVNNILPGQYLYRRYFVSGNDLFEDCFIPKPVFDNPEAPQLSESDFSYDYECRTRCWEVIRNYTINLFDDNLTNGGGIMNRSIGKIPFYQRDACLVELRQMSLGKEAYEYFKLFQQQIQNSGGIADTPPTALKGNIQNVSNIRENVVGYFSASAVSSISYWLERKDTGGTVPPGLFEALMGRAANPEPPPPYEGPRGQPLIFIWGGPPRVPTAICVKSNNRTPFKPEGWRDE